jgi:galactonate dehydratase
MTMQRRRFMQTTLLGAGAALAGRAADAEVFAPATADLSGLKIKRVSFYNPPDYEPRILAQARGVVTVECDNGLTGIGEGGTPDLVENVAPWLIGQDPLNTEHIWQLMFRGDFYPGGRELQHAIGALDIALWDIKGKLLDQPIYNLLGGRLRDYIPCYSTGYPWQGSYEATARACVEEGFKAYRIHAGSQRDERSVPWDVDQEIGKVAKVCEDITRGVDGIGEWAIDFHTRFDSAHAIRLANLIEPLHPIFVEDLIRSENQHTYRHLRQQVSVPIALGEHFGVRWDFHRLVEEDLMDYCRATLPNTAGITEFKKILSMCETHYVGTVPHFTGPIATVALTQCLAAYTGFAMMEMLDRGRKAPDYLNPDAIDFRDGKLYPRKAPGLGIEFDASQSIKMLEVTEGTGGPPSSVLRRPDGSYTNW